MLEQVKCSTHDVVEAFDEVLGKGNWYLSSKTTEKFFSTHPTFDDVWYYPQVRGYYFYLDNKTKSYTATFVKSKGKYKVVVHK